MQRVAIRAVSPWLAVILLSAASLAGGALFEAPGPGADLEPVNGAEQLIQLLQGQRSLLWTSLGGTVEAYTVIGWPSRQGDSELGGALMIQRPEDGTAGVIAFGEKPMSLHFELDG